MTPVKVRGKRHAPKAEKWRAGKQRDPGRIASIEPSESGSAVSSRSSSIARPARKRRKIALSKLELLPTEILQEIFDFCYDVNLPDSSPYIAEKLSSEQIYIRTAFNVINPCLNVPYSGLPGRHPVFDTSHEVTRLFSCRWFTWAFFQRWLRLAYKGLEESAARIPDNRKALDWSGIPQWPIAEDDEPKLADPRWLKRKGLFPCDAMRSGLLLPAKLLARPWTNDKLEFLDWLTSGLGHVRFAHSTHGEIAASSMREAIGASQPRAVAALLKAGVPSTKNLLHLAVLDHDCHRTIVYLLLRRAIASRGHPSMYPKEHHSDVEQSNVDFLDVALWTWAERAELNNNGKGSWLLHMLRLAQAALRELSLEEFEQDFADYCVMNTNGRDDLQFVAVGGMGVMA